MDARQIATEDHRGLAFMRREDRSCGAACGDRPDALDPSDPISRRAVGRFLKVLWWFRVVPGELGLRESFVELEIIRYRQYWHSMAIVSMDRAHFQTRVFRLRFRVRQSPSPSGFICSSPSSTQSQCCTTRPSSLLRPLASPPAFRRP